MRNLFASKVPAGIAIGCALVVAISVSAAVLGRLDEQESKAPRSPALFASLLSRHDHMIEGPARDAVALEVDRVGAQRYASTSRLYWYTSLVDAEAAARAAHRPILALRMLGRLDEDLSCANSRLFRTTLYANTAVGKFLRDNFILYWSSERPVPKVTIDFGDGRKLERTTTGNSAHYVLDEDGTVLDVLPGLYAPAVFQTELAKSLELARRVRGVDARQRVAATIAFHTEALERSKTAFAAVAGGRYRRISSPGELARAQEITMAKSSMERPDLARIGMHPGSIAVDDINQWTVIGMRAFQLGTEETAAGTTATDPRAAVRNLLDPQSLALIVKLHNAVPAPLVAKGEQLAGILSRLERNVIADTAINELQLRDQIRSQIIRTRDLRFATLNSWIYATVFHTPKADAWVGLLERTNFTGLPGDGVVMP